MKFPIIFVLCLIPLLPANPVQESFPLYGYPIQIGSETLFKYKSVLSTSKFLFEMSTSYDLDLIVRLGPEPRMLLIAIDNVEFTSDTEEPTDEELAFMELPFALYLDKDGDWVQAKMNPDETWFSLNRKGILIDMLVFNMTEIEELRVKHGVRQKFDRQTVETGLGNNCHGQAVFKSFNDKVVLSNDAVRINCTGKSEVEIKFGEVSPHSSFETKYHFDKDPFLFKKNEHHTYMVMGRPFDGVLKDVSSLKYVGVRPFSRTIDTTALTKSYNKETFEEQLDLLRAAR